jgi:hypothetical protein
LPESPLAAHAKHLDAVGNGSKPFRVLTVRSILPQTTVPPHVILSVCEESAHHRNPTDLCVNESLRILRIAQNDTLGVLFS